MELSKFKKDNLDLAKIEINKIATRLASKLPEIKKEISEDTYTLLSDALVIAENINNNKDKEFLKTSMQRFSSKLCEAGFNDFYQLDPDFRKQNKETVLKNITPVKPRTAEPNKELISNTPEDFKFTASAEPPMKVAHRILDDLRHKYYSSAQDAYEGYCQDAGPWPYASSYQKWKLGQILTHFGFVINYDKFEKQAKKDYETQMKSDKKRKNVDADPNKVEAQLLGNPLTGQDAVKGFVDKIQDIAKRKDTQALRQVQNEMMQYRQKNGGTNPDLNRLLDVVTGVLYKISNQAPETPPAPATNAQKLDKKKMRQDFAEEFGAPPPSKNDFNIIPEEDQDQAAAPMDMSQMTPNQIAEMEQSNKLREQMPGIEHVDMKNKRQVTDPYAELMAAILNYGRQMNAPKPVPQVDNNEPIPVDTSLLQKSSNKQDSPRFTPLFQYFWDKVHDPVGPYAQDGSCVIEGKNSKAQAVGSPIPAGTADNMSGNSTALPMQDHPIMACQSCGYKDTTAGMMKEGDNCPTCNGAGSMQKHSMHNYAKLVAKNDGYLTKEEVEKLSPQAADIMYNENMLKVKARYFLNRVLPYVTDTK